VLFGAKTQADPCGHFVEGLMPGGSSSDVHRTWWWPPRA
jgi:hypothetical protein